MKRRSESGSECSQRRSHQRVAMERRSIDPIDLAIRVGSTAVVVVEANRNVTTVATIRSLSAPISISIHPGPCTIARRPSTAFSADRFKRTGCKSGYASHCRFGRNDFGPRSTRHVQAHKRNQLRCFLYPRLADVSTVPEDQTERSSVW